MRKLVSLAMVFAILTSHTAFAQNERDSELVTQGPSKHLSKIVFAGLAGAILGLSTLSFYGRPQDKLSNIAVGFAIGVIGGTLFTTYKAVDEPKDFYGLRHDVMPQYWALGDQKPEPQAPSLGYSFEF